MKETTTTTIHDIFTAVRRMFVQEHLRALAMITAVNQGVAGCSGKCGRVIMEHKVVQNLKAAKGDKSMFRQWHQKFTTVLGQVKVEYE